jgi:tripartite-type tricarboxylate transporter receptor subunit TctC
VMRWNQIVADWLKTEEAQARLKAEGMEPGGGPPEEFAKVVSGAVERWRRVIREAKIKPET